MCKFWCTLFLLVVLNTSSFALRVVSLSPNLTMITHTLITASKNKNIKLVGTIQYQGAPKYFSDITNVGNASAINISEIMKLRPDVILAWQKGGNLQSIARLKQLGLHVEIFNADSLEGIGNLVKKIGQAIGLPSEANTLSQNYVKKLKHLQGNQVKSGKIKKPLVLMEFSAFPLYVAGGKGIFNEVIDFCGGRNAFQDLNSESAEVSKVAVLKRNPDIILSLVEPLPKDQAFRKISGSSWQQWLFLNAVKDKQIYQLNPNLLSQMTPNILKGVRAVCKTIRQRPRQTV